MNQSTLEQRIENETQDAKDIVNFAVCLPIFGLVGYVLAHAMAV